MTSNNDFLHQLTPEERKRVRKFIESERETGVGTFLEKKRRVESPLSPLQKSFKDKRQQSHEFLQKHQRCLNLVPSDLKEFDDFEADPKKWEDDKQIQEFLDQRIGITNEFGADAMETLPPDQILRLVSNKIGLHTEAPPLNGRCYAARTLLKVLIGQFFKSRATVINYFDKTTLGTNITGTVLAPDSFAVIASLAAPTRNPREQQRWVQFVFNVLLSYHPLKYQITDRDFPIPFRTQYVDRPLLEEIKKFNEEKATLKVKKKRAKEILGQVADYILETPMSEITQRGLDRQPLGEDLFQYQPYLTKGFQRLFDAL